MANCSFIQATEARNIARNNTVIWEEICEVQTQILAGIDGNVYSIIVNDGTPFTATQSILSATVTAGGSGYIPVVATAVINNGGTAGIGALVTPTVTGTTITGFTIDNGGSLVLQTATVVTRGTGYSINDTLTVVGGTFTSAATLTVTALSTIAAQDETAYSVFVGGDGAGGTAYVVNDVITLDDGSTITVDAIDGSGDVTQFTVTTASTIGITGDLAVLSQLGATVGAGDGIGFTMTQQLTNQGIFTATIATAGVYTVLPASPAGTTVSPVNGTGATLNVTITAGYAPVSVSASVDTPNDLIDSQDETNFDNVLPNGTFNAGDSYRVGEVITLVDASTVTVAAGGISATGVVNTQGQTQADWVLAAGGDGVGGTAYVVADIITLNDGSTVTVNSIDGNGDVVNFTITTASTASYTSGANLFQQGQVDGLGNGLGFTLTSAVGNEITVGGVTLFDTASAGSTLYFQTTLLQLSTDGIGSSFTLTPAGNNQISVIQGTGVSLVVTETGGVITNVTAAGGSGYALGATITFTHPSGINAAATVTSVVSTVITGITVSNGGSGYEQAVATVTVTAPGGLIPALAFAGTVVTTGGSVTGISIQEGGVGYAELLPTVSATDPTGTGATFTTNVAGGQVTAINVIDGGSGFTAPTLTITAAPTSNGSGATATASIGTNIFSTIPTDYFNVFAGLTTDAVISDQLQFVLDYFTSLGYNIRIQTNSTTTNTIQWQIIW